jgi:predicted ATPase
MSDCLQPHFQNIFIGRTDLLKELLSIKNQVASQRSGRLVLLSHEGGIGKTTLVRQFLGEVSGQADPPAIFSVDCVHIAQSREPFKPFSGLLEQIANSRTQPYQGWLHRLSPKLFEGVPWVGPVLGATVQMFLDKKKTETSTHLVSANSAILEYIQLLREMTQLKPMILFIDDLHWMDASSADLLYAITRQIEKMTLMLVGNYRSDEIEAPPGEPERPFRAVLLELRRYKLAKIFELRPFSQEEVKQYLDAVFDPNDFPVELIEKLSRQTGGLPFYFTELALYLYETGAIAERSGAWQATDLAREISIPASVEALIQVRMGTMQASQQKLLRTPAYWESSSARQYWLN